jgi:methenyltetrahydrofolate cyclohydrolase
VLADSSLTALLDAFASPSPTPGGGSASALAGAIGAALCEMVASLPKTRTNVDEERARMRDARERLHALRSRLVELVDEDSAAYEAVVAAYRLPKETDEQKAARRSRIHEALTGAAGTPLEVMRVSAEAVDAAQNVAKVATRSASSDVGVALELLGAALAGAVLNVRINLEELADRSQAEHLARQADELRARADTSIEGARRALAD